jgi:glutamate synthase domain-containing protein 1
MDFGKLPHDVGRKARDALCCNSSRGATGGAPGDGEGQRVPCKGSGRALRGGKVRGWGSFEA